MTPSLAVAAESSAAQQAARNWTANLESIRASQPGSLAALRDAAESVEWLFARDGSLTAMLPGERWWAGCSVPSAAAQFMLKKMEPGGNVACFLSPDHAAKLRVALDQLESRQAIIAIIPEPLTLWVILHCDDFTQEIENHRLWFAAGEPWENALERLFVDQPGLPTPVQFIRPILIDPDRADRLIAPAQKIFAAENARRAEQVRSLVSRARHSRGVHRLCVIARSGFRLWDSASSVLANALESAAADGIAVRRFDPDDPASASPLALASAIAECDAVLSANLARADVPELAALDVPWISWMTIPRIPQGATARPNDALLPAEPEWHRTAVERGWPGHRVRMAAWPTSTRPEAPSCHSVAIVADTEPLQPPKRVEDYSSHKLLWEMIADELLHDPFVIGGDVEEYIRRKMARTKIAEAGFDQALFIEHLIVPAYQQGLARLLVREAVATHLWGKGWDEIESLAPYHRGTVTSANQLDAIAAEARALVHVWPSRTAHPIDSMNRPVIRAFGQTRESFLQDARAALKGSIPLAHSRQQPISWELIAPLLA